MPDAFSGRPGPGSSPRKKNPVKLAVGVVAVVAIAAGVGWGLTHLPGGAPGAPPGGPGRPGAPPGGGPPGGGGFGGPGGGGRGGGRAAITVGTGQATIGPVPIQLDALGTVTPPVTATITSRIAGNLMAVYFTEGQMVKKGQKLALIDPRPYQVALQQAEGALARDQAALTNAKVDQQRYKTLLAESSTSKQQVDTQDALVLQDQAAVQTDQAAVASAKLNLSYTSITAPVDGRVGLRLVDVGNYVQAGGGGLLVITQIDPIDVVFTVPEDNVAQINRRQRAGMPMPTTVFDRSGGQVLAQGSLSTLDNQIDTGTGTVKAKARFNNGAGLLFPNQFVNVRLLTDVLCNAVIVPATAVRHGSQGDYVFTLQPNRTAKMVMVTTGPGTGESVSIAKGLLGNETVITEGGDRLRDGSQVQLPGQGGPPGGSGFSGGRRGRPGGGQSGQRAPGGQGGPGFPAGPRAGGPPGQGGPGGGFRRGGAGGPAAGDAESRITQAQAIPVAEIPPGACAGSGLGGPGMGGKGPGGRFAGGPAGGQGFGPGGVRRGQFGGPPPEGAGPRDPGAGGPGRGPRGQFGGPAPAGAGFQGQGFQGQGGPGQGGPPSGGFRRRGQGAPGSGGDQPPGQGQGG